MLQEENVKKCQMFLIFESKVGESILAIFFVVFSLKKGQEMDGRHANFRDRTKEKKCMHY